MMIKVQQRGNFILLLLGAYLGTWSNCSFAAVGGLLILIVYDPSAGFKEPTGEQGSQRGSVSYDSSCLKGITQVFRAGVQLQVG